MACNKQRFAEMVEKFKVAPDELEITTFEYESRSCLTAPNTVIYLSRKGYQTSRRIQLGFPTDTQKHVDKYQRWLQEIVNRDEVTAGEMFKALENGCDVSSLVQAMAIRWLEFHHPDMIDVVGPMGEYPVTAKLPYLGAILKPLGRKSRGTVVDCLRGFLHNPNYDRANWKKFDNTGAGK